MLHFLYIFIYIFYTILYRKHSMKWSVVYVHDFENWRVFLADDMFNCCVICQLANMSWAIVCLFIWSCSLVYSTKHPIIAFQYYSWLLSTHWNRTETNPSKSWVVMILLFSLFLSISRITLQICKNLEVRKSWMKISILIMH